MKLNLRKMWQWLSSGRVNWRLSKSDEHSDRIPVFDDDYLAEELFRRAIASAHMSSLQDDIVNRFSSVVPQLELPPQARIFQLQLSAWFRLCHPLLTWRTRRMKRELQTPPHIGSEAGYQNELMLRCRHLLDEVEFGCPMPARARLAAWDLKNRCHWSLNQLRRSIIAGVVIADTKKGISLEKPSVFSNIVLVVTGLIFVLPASALAMYGTHHYFDCGVLDCITAGAIQVALISGCLGFMPLRLFRMRWKFFKTVQLQFRPS